MNMRYLLILLIILISAQVYAESPEHVVLLHVEDTWPFEFINGPAGKELGTDEMAVPYDLGRVDFETGIITGDRSLNWINSLIIPGRDDGKVSVNSAGIEGMADFLVLHVSHTFIMMDKIAIMNCLYFIKNGYFKQTSR